MRGSHVYRHYKEAMIFKIHHLFHCMELPLDEHVIVSVYCFHPLENLQKPLQVFSKGLFSMATVYVYMT